MVTNIFKTSLWPRQREAQLSVMKCKCQTVTPNNFRASDNVQFDLRPSASWGGQKLQFSNTLLQITSEKILVLRISLLAQNARFSAPKFVLVKEKFLNRPKIRGGCIANLCYDATIPGSECHYFYQHWRPASKFTCALGQCGGVSAGWLLQW